MTPQDDDTLQIVPDPDKLDRYHRQQLSAMLDGELSPDQARFMLRRLQHDVELADCWERWQVCGDVLRGQRNAMLPADFAREVAHALAGGKARDAAVAAAPAIRPRLLRWGGGAALAASVAMAALLVARQPGLDPLQSPAEEVRGTGVALAPPAPAAVQVDGTDASGQGAAVAGTAAALAGTAVLAAAERPRGGGGERRPGGQEQRTAAAGARAQPRRSPDSDPRSVAAVAPSPAAGQSGAAEPAALAMPVIAQVPGTAAGADPFAALPMTAASRPWPGAGLPGLAGRPHAAGYGAVDASRWASFHPFEPRQAVAPADSGLGALDAFAVPGFVPMRPPAADSTAIGADAIPAAGGRADDPR